MVALAKQMLHSSETHVTLADIAYHTTRPISSVFELLHVDRWTNREINMCIFGTYCLCMDKKSAEPPT
jgi:hypothetical protein